MSKLQNMRHNRAHVHRIVECIQSLEDISGPDSIEDYITVLTIVRAEIDKRIADAAEGYEDFIESASKS